MNKTWFNLRGLSAPLALALVLWAAMGQNASTPTSGANDRHAPRTARAAKKDAGAAIAQTPEPRKTTPPITAISDGTGPAGRLAAEGTIWRYEDVGHLALMLEDGVAAAWFVQWELGPLTQPGARTQEIRDTVRLYLSSGNSRVAVADALHVAPNTVAYRVGKANELLGYPVGERAQQILLALQLVQLVPSLLEPPPS
jgi:hypothetical protein